MRITTIEDIKSKIGNIFADMNKAPTVVKKLAYVVAVAATYVTLAAVGLALTNNPQSAMHTTVSQAANIVIRNPDSVPDTNLQNESLYRNPDVVPDLPTATKAMRRR